VLGDPHHARPEGRARLVQEIALLAAYQRSAAPDARLGGLQLDIEPYILAEYANNAAAWIADYRLTIGAARQVWPDALDLVMPFWWSGDAIWRPLRPALDTLRGVSVTVMDYRTAPWELRRRAESFLQWGAETRHAVQVAVELGAIPDNTQMRFTSAASGELWEVMVDGRRALLLLDRAGVPPSGRAFRISFTRVVSGGEVSFRGDWQGLLDASRALETDFRASPAFLGIALHGADDRTVRPAPVCADCRRPVAARRPR
jgi:hypothetical protein